MRVFLVSGRRKFLQAARTNPSHLMSTVYCCRVASTYQAAAIPAVCLCVNTLDETKAKTAKKTKKKPREFTVN